MQEQYDQWWLDNKVHYTYLGFSIVFLIFVHLFQNDGLSIKILLIIHLLLLIGKLYFNTFMMRLFFGIRQKKQNKKDLIERTIKIQNAKKNVYRRDPRSTVYNRYNRIEDVMFGSKDTNRHLHYDSLYQSKGNQQNRIFDTTGGNQGASYYKNNNSYYPESTNRRSYINEQSSFGQNRSPTHRQFDQNNIHIRPFDNLESYANNSRSKYDNLDRKPQYRTNQIISRPNNNSFSDNRFGQTDYLNDYERYPDRSGNLNPHYQRRLQQQVINKEVVPLEKQFIKYNVSKQAAIRMILLVRSYFEEKMRQYKMNQTVNLNKLKFLLKKITSSSYEPPSIEAMISKAKQIVSSSMVSTFNVRDKQSTVEQLRDVLSKIYYQGKEQLNTKQSYLRFYKEQTSRSVLQNINLQIVTTQKFDTSAHMMPRFTYQIYYNPQRDFCYFHRQQQNHMYNLEETFLLLILSCKNDFPTSTLIRDIMTYSTLRNDAPPILY